MWGSLLRPLLLAVLLAGLARAAPPRDVDAILDDHAEALGDAAKVKSLRGTFDAGDSRIRVKGATWWWRAPGTLVRQFPTGAGQAPWLQYFTPKGAFFSKGVFERYRPEQASTRGGYYFYKLLSEPFPLLPYLADHAARRALRLGAAKGYEVLYGPFDANGVRIAYLLDPETHLVSRVQAVEENDQPIVSLNYDRYKRVGKVMLPHAIYARYLLRYEDPDKRRVVARSPVVWQDRIATWEVNPRIDERLFLLPGLGKGGAKGFERHLYTTGPDPGDLAVGDLDGDGKPDIAVACWGGIYVHFGGNEKDPVAVALGKGHHAGCAIEDFDLDGRPDVVTTSNVDPGQVFFFVSFDAQRKPKVRKLYGAPLFASDLATPDLDLDGIPDLVSSGFGSSTLDIAFGNGSGRLRLVGSPWPLDAARRNRHGFGLAIGNLDGDPRKDIAVADGTRLVIFQGQVNLSFQPRIVIPEKERPGWRPVDVTFVDLDLDGRDDLLAVREHPFMDLPGDLIVVRNRGDKLEVTGSIEVGSRVQSVATGLLDRDAFPDAAATSFLTGEVTLVHGDGKGGFGKPERLRCDRGASRVVVADVDSDSRDDLVVANRLGDSITVLLNRREARHRVHAAAPRAEACPPPTREAFDLKGLTDPYEFGGEFRLPVRIRDPSGLAVLGGIANTQLVLVSDKRSAIFRAVLDRRHNRLLVGPEIPLRGLEEERLDLEGVAFDRPSGNLFLGCEADSSVIRASLWGDVLGRAPTGIASGGNDGIEALALRRLKDNTPLLYVFKERNGKTLTQPIVRVFGIEEEPFKLVQRGEDLRLPRALPDQTGATVAWGRLFVTSRLFRGIAEVEFSDNGFSGTAGVASFAPLTDGLLGLASRFGVVEGIAIGPSGDIFLIADNNGEVLGRKGRNRGPEGRLLWFRNRGDRRLRPLPRRVTVKQMTIPFTGAENAPGVKLDKEQARKIALQCLQRIRAGEDFDAIARDRGYTRSRLPLLVRLAGEGIKPRLGEYPRRKVPRAFAELAFNLAVGEAGLCEYDKRESPDGFHVLLRIE